MAMIGFHHGMLADPYELQANEQGYTFGSSKEKVQKIGDSIVLVHVHGCITDSEYDKILQRFQKKVLATHIMPLEENDNE